MLCSMLSSPATRLVCCLLPPSSPPSPPALGLRYQVREGVTKGEDIDGGEVLDGVMHADADVGGSVGRGVRRRLQQANGTATQVVTYFSEVLVGLVQMADVPTLQSRR